MLQYLKKKNIDLNFYLKFALISQVNLHIFGPQVIVAANTFCAESTSKEPSPLDRKMIDEQTDSKKDKEADKQTDTQIDRQTERQKIR